MEFWRNIFVTIKFTLNNIQARRNHLINIGKLLNPSQFTFKIFSSYICLLMFFILPCSSCAFLWNTCEFVKKKQNTWKKLDISSHFTFIKLILKHFVRIFHEFCTFFEEKSITLIKFKCLLMLLRFKCFSRNIFWWNDLGFFDWKRFIWRILNCTFSRHTFFQALILIDLLTNDEK